MQDASFDMRGAAELLFDLSPRLLVAEASKLQAGAFYLDREPQVKHMAGCLRRMCGPLKRLRILIAFCNRAHSVWV